MNSELNYTYSTTKPHYRGIYTLQKQNLEANLNEADVKSQGFVSVDHSEQLLARLGKQYGHSIALHGDRVVGYALVMLNEFKNEVPILVPMFEQIDQILQREPWKDLQNYFIMGQICVDKDFRGLGLVSNLYENMKKLMAPNFDCVITEVSARNPRSIRAHEKIGFKNLHTYTNDCGETWKIIYWDWS